MKATGSDRGGVGAGRQIENGDTQGEEKEEEEEGKEDKNLMGCL